MQRRHVLNYTLLGIGTGALGMSFFNRGQAAAQPSSFEVQFTEAQWREKLSPEQFRVLRGHGTERAGSSALDDEKRAGVFYCAGCELALFDSATKYDSRTGWPSFFKPIDGAIGTQVDKSLFSTRTEVHCRRCGGHLGHVFEDGPEPTGLRYCMNGIAMKFVPSNIGN